MKNRFLESFAALFRGYYAAIGAAIVIGFVLIATSEYTAHNAQDAALDSRESAARQSKINELLRVILDIETAQRGYVITGDGEYLKSYREAVALLNPALDALRDAYTESEKPLASISPLTRAAMRKYAEMEVIVRLRQNGDDATDWKSAIATGLGRTYMDDVRTSASTLLASERELHRRHFRRYEQAVLFSRVAISVAAALSLIVFGMFLFESRKRIKLAESQQSLLAEERQRLQQLVDERTKEIGELANHLIGVQEREREDVAKELHDELGSILTAVKFDLSRIESRVPLENEDMRRRLTNLSELLNRSIAVKRQLIEALRPSALSKLGLIAAVDGLVEEFEQRYPIKVSVAIDPEPLSAALELALFRVIQESLTNVAKYARATAVEVRIQRYPKFVELTVRDNGVGFVPAEHANSSYGIPGMRHRIRSFGGRLEVESAPNEGCTVRATLPWKQLAARGHDAAPAASSTNARAPDAPSRPDSIETQQQPTDGNRPLT